MEPNKTEDNISTEEKIKRAAQSVFLKKGYSATRTRDIAEAAGENLALINYYFRSKENLYRIIMMETMGAFLNTMTPIVNDKNTSLEEKIESMIGNYIDLFSQRPDMPLFVLNELNGNSESFMEKTAIKAKMLDSVFFKQLTANLKRSGSKISPLHIFINMISMIIFPFIASPLIKGLHGMQQDQFIDMMQTRKKMIPIWINNMIKS